MLGTWFWSSKNTSPSDQGVSPEFPLLSDPLVSDNVPVPLTNIRIVDDYLLNSPPKSPQGSPRSPDDIRESVSPGQIPLPESPHSLPREDSLDTFLVSPIQVPILRSVSLPLLIPSRSKDPIDSYDSDEKEEPSNQSETEDDLMLESQIRRFDTHELDELIRSLEEGYVMDHLSDQVEEDIRIPRLETDLPDTPPSRPIDVAPNWPEYKDEEWNTWKEREEWNRMCYEEITPSKSEAIVEPIQPETPSEEHDVYVQRLRGEIDQIIAQINRLETESRLLDQVRQSETITPLKVNVIPVEEEEEEDNSVSMEPADSFDDFLKRLSIASDLIAQNTSHEARRIMESVSKIWSETMVATISVSNTTVETTERVSEATYQSLMSENNSASCEEAIKKVSPENRDVILWEQHMDVSGERLLDSFCHLREYVGGIWERFVHFISDTSLPYDDNSVDPADYSELRYRRLFDAYE